ncbi:MAG: rhomboid family intramembrane serine protease [Rhodospirillales bacterium]
MIPFRTDAPSLGSPAVTMSLIVANIAVYFYQLGLSPQNELYFLYTYALVPVILSDPSIIAQTGLSTNPYLTLITNTFMHGGALHLIINIWTLWLFGAPLEDRMGRLRFLLFYLVCGALGSYGHYIFNTLSTIPALGASGAIAGVLGGYTYIFPKARVHVIQPIFFFPLVFRLPALIYTGIWFAIQLFQGTASLGTQNGSEVGGIAWWAHIGGFAGGIALVWLLYRNRGGRPTSGPTSRSTKTGRSQIPRSGG